MEIKRTSTFPEGSFHVDARYAPEAIIGTGAYGLVCSAKDRLTKEKVAIKKIAQAFQIHTIAKRTLREIKLLKHFHAHENIISVLTILSPPENPTDFRDLYITMELQETDLHRIIHSDQPLTEEHARYFLWQLLRGLKYIHSANVLHRDIKPANLLINSNCDLKICDFGMARGFASTLEEHAGFMTAYVATRWYRAPEVMLSFKEYTQAIDMWSVGCIFAEMLGRRYLFPGDHYVHQINLILNVLGSPSADVIDKIGSEQVQRYFRSLPNIAAVPLKKLYPDASSPAIDLVTQMLKFDPATRITVDSALDHPFVARYHEAKDEPVCDPFDFDFDEEAIELEDVKQRILQEVADYQPKSSTKVGAAGPRHKVDSDEPVKSKGKQKKPQAAKDGSRPGSRKRKKTTSSITDTEPTQDRTEFPEIPLQASPKKKTKDATPMLSATTISAIAQELKGFDETLWLADVSKICDMDPQLELDVLQQELELGSPLVFEKPPGKAR